MLIIMIADTNAPLPCFVPHPFSCMILVSHREATFPPSVATESHRNGKISFSAPWNVRFAHMPAHACQRKQFSSSYRVCCSQFIFTISIQMQNVCPCIKSSGYYETIRENLRHSAIIKMILFTFEKLLNILHVRCICTLITVPTKSIATENIPTWFAEMIRI